MSQEIKKMDIKEFREEGFLQEINRLFLHPLGLALEVQIDDEGNETLGGIWDYRDDPEGILFEDGTINPVKAMKFQTFMMNQYKTRIGKIGFLVQKLPNLERKKDETE